MRVKKCCTMLFLLIAFAFVLLPARSAVAICAPCDECSADPVFVQRDARSPQTVLMLRRFASREVQKEGLKAVVVFSDTVEGCCGQLSQPKHTVVLLGSKGASKSIEVKGAMPAELNTLMKTQ